MRIVIDERIRKWNMQRRPLIQMNNILRASVGVTGAFTGRFFLNGAGKPVSVGAGADERKGGDACVAHSHQRKGSYTGRFFLSRPGNPVSVGAGADEGKGGDACVAHSHQRKGSYTGRFFLSRPGNPVSVGAGADEGKGGDAAASGG
jgi:hypothetical protein